MNKLSLNYELKNRYRIIKHVSESNFSNIYLVLYKNRKYIVKECFPLNIVIRDEENKVFTEKYKSKFKMIKNNFMKEAEIIRKFKPSNIIVDINNSIKIIDFGSSINISEKNKGYLKWTPGYSPLEMYSLKAENDQKTDIYSLCALLYFMLNKYRPMDSLKRFYYPELIYEDYVSRKIRKIIEKGINMERKERYENIEELEKELTN